MIRITCEKISSKNARCQIHPSFVKRFLFKKVKIILDETYPSNIFFTPCLYSNRITSRGRTLILSVAIWLFVELGLPLYTGNL